MDNDRCDMIWAVIDGHRQAAWNLYTPGGNSWDLGIVNFAQYSVGYIDKVHSDSLGIWLKTELSLDRIS